MYFFKEEIVKQFGSLSMELTNQGPTFLWAACKKNLKLREPKDRVMATYCSQLNGRAERMMQKN